MTDAQQAIAAPASGQPPVAIRGADVRRCIPHWCDGRLRRLELRLVGGDVVVIDAFLLRILLEVGTCVQRARV